MTITKKDYSAMQWPCPNWYHVPLSSEWQALYDAWISIGAWTSSWWTNFKDYLKMPFAGYRIASSADVNYQGSFGYYWSSSRYDTNTAYILNFNSTALTPQNAKVRSCGYPVRPFKDKAVKPDNSWTTLYDGSSVTSGAWVFHNATLWLISVSWDGSTWITIADKNLWATTVYNNWDTLSESNCGWYFQRWNNYMFPFTWSVTTSSTQVDASAYWPWNYYNSSTFITYSGRRDTTDNADLWGGETGVIETIPDLKIVKAMHNWNEYTIGSNKETIYNVDVLVVWWWGWWSDLWWWGWWWVLFRDNYALTCNAVCVTIGSWWWAKQNWWDSCFASIIWYWWWHWWDWADWRATAWWSWGWAWYAAWWHWAYWHTCWWISCVWQWFKWWDWYWCGSSSGSNRNVWWWWGWAWWQWWDVDNYWWWTPIWWSWLALCIKWEEEYYWAGWWWTNWTWQCWWCWWWWNYWCAATWLWWWGWGWWWAWNSWVVIVRYHTDWTDNITNATWWCKYTCGDYTIHCFTSDGTFCVIS